MVKTSITIWNIVQITLNLAGFLMFMGFFNLPASPAVGKKAGLLIMFAHLSCIGHCTFGLILNCYAQLIDQSQRRQSDLNILLYGLYFLGAICAVGFVFYWVAILSKPVAILILAQKVRGMLLLFLMFNFTVMVLFTYVAYITLNYISGFPNGWGKEKAQYTEVKKPIEAENKTVPVYILQ
jgi:hypothetical protein